MRSALLLAALLCSQAASAQAFHFVKTPPTPGMSLPLKRGPTTPGSNRPAAKSSLRISPRAAGLQNRH